MILTRTFIIRAFVALALARAAAAQTPVATISPSPILQFWDLNGKPLSGGQICVYAAGTTTPVSLFKDAAGTVPWGNPITLDASGRAVAYVPASSLKFVLRLKGSPNNCSSGNILYTVDNVQDAGLKLRTDLATPGANVPDAGLELRTDLAGAGGAGMIGFSPPGGTVTLPVSTVLRAGVVYPQSFGAKCDGTTDDSAAFTAAVAAAIPGDTISVYSANGTGCVLKTGFTINKILALTSGAPTTASPAHTAQLIAGANNITMVTVQATGLTHITNIAFNAGTATGVRAIFWNGQGGSSPINHNYLDGVTFNGPFADALFCDNSYINTITNTNVFAAIEGFNLNEQCNSTTMVNPSFYAMGGAGATAPGIAVNAHNMQGLFIFGGTFECGSEGIFYNMYGLTLDGIYAENAAGCPSMTGANAAGYLNIGGSFAGTPVYGVQISGNVFNGTAQWGVTIGYGRGVSISGNTFQNCPQSVSGTCDAGALAVNVQTSASATSTYALNDDIHLGPNDYGVMTETQRMGFTGGGNNNTTASNVSTSFTTPMRFSWAMPQPQQAHVPQGDCTTWYGTQDGSGNTQGSFRGLCNTAGTFTTRYPITDLSCIATSASDACEFYGTLKVLPQGSLPGSPAPGYAILSMVNGSRAVYFLQDDAAGSVCGIPYAACLNWNSSQPFVLKSLPASAGSGGQYACIDNNGQVYRKSSCP